jgi:hypothetical protein
MTQENLEDTALRRVPVEADVGRPTPSYHCSRCQDTGVVLEDWGEDGMQYGDCPKCKGNPYPNYYP